MIPAVVDEAARRFGDTPAYVAARGWPLSYRQLAQRSHEVAAALIHRGIGEGDVVALVLPATPEYVVAYIAATRVGAITAGVNARLTPRERAAVLEIARPRLVITTAELAATGTGADEGPAAGPGAGPTGNPAGATAHPGGQQGPGADDPPAGWDTVVIDLAPRAEQLLDGLREPGSWVDPLPADADRTVAIVFTSGTTGVPKGAVFTNRQIDFITAVDTGRRWGGGGAQLAGTSFAHLGPMTKLAGTLHRGGTIHLVDRWRADQALALVEQERMAGLGGIPTQIALMLREPNFDLYDLDCVRAIVIGGGPSTPALVREARTRFGAALSVRYSCTEAGIGTGTAFDAPAEDAEVSVGRPHDGVVLTIVGDDDEPVPAGSVGEVTLRSPAVMRGYWRDPDATRAAFTPDGAVRTGDLGFVDEQGRLRLVGRRKELYVRGGYNVYPAEVEAVLVEHPDLVDVAIVPRPDPVMGEVGVAVVVVRDPAAPPDLAAVRAAGEARLASYKLPADVLVVDALPLTPMDKVDRRALAELVRAQPPRA